MKKRKHINQFNLADIRNSSKQQPPQSIGQVYSMLNRQEQAIALLLRKYEENDNPTSTLNISRDAGLYDDYIKPRGQTIDTSVSSNIKLKLVLSRGQKPETRQSSLTGRRTDLTISDQYQSLHDQPITQRRRNQSVSLPIIQQKNKLEKSKGKPKNSYQIMAHFKRERARMENRLYQIYGQKNSYFSNQNNNLKSSISSRAKPKNKKKSKNTNSPKQETPSLLTNEEQNKQMHESEDRQQRNETKVEIESDDESEGQEIPTMYYQREFRDLMRGQCLQELNFLYFSKNQKMKDWTDTLLSMIEKHDKEVMAVRKKSKYLQTFDDKFFSIGIFNTDDV